MTHFMESTETLAFIMEYMRSRAEGASRPESVRRAKEFGALALVQVRGYNREQRRYRR